MTSAWALDATLNAFFSRSVRVRFLLLAAQNVKHARRIRALAQIARWSLP
jgi:hypothetical protein